MGLLTLVSETLLSDSYETLLASDGDEAWDLLQRHRQKLRGTGGETRPSGGYR